MSQAVGLAEAVGWPIETKTVRLRAPWSLLPGHLCPLALSGLREPLAPHWPDLLITCGRRSVAVSIAIRKASRGHTFTVHVQNPRAPARFFDLVAPPRHDGMSGANVLPTRGALHRITRRSSKLQRLLGASDWGPRRSRSSLAVIAVSTTLRRTAPRRWPTGWRGSAALS